MPWEHEWHVQVIQVLDHRLSHLKRNIDICSQLFYPSVHIDIVCPNLIDIGRNVGRSPHAGQEEQR